MNGIVKGLRFVLLAGCIALAASTTASARVYFSVGAVGVGPTYYDDDYYAGPTRYCYYDYYGYYHCRVRHSYYYAPVYPSTSIVIGGGGWHHHHHHH